MVISSFITVRRTNGMEWQLLFTASFRDQISLFEQIIGRFIAIKTHASSKPLFLIAAYSFQGGWKEKEKDGLLNGPS